MGNVAVKTRLSRHSSTQGQVQPLARTTVGDALFTTTQQRVLGFLYGQPERSFFANEIIGLTGSGSGAVQRELARLVDSGLVTSRSIGRQRHYQANTGAPIFDELRSIIVKTVGLAEPLRAALGPLGHRITLALVYGSIAKGTATAASDIDLLVVADDLTLEDLYSALEPGEQQLGRKVRPTLYTIEEFARRRATGNSFVTEVLSGAKIKLIGDANDIAAAR